MGNWWGIDPKTQKAIEELQKQWEVIRKIQEPIIQAHRAMKPIIDIHRAFTASTLLPQKPPTTAPDPKVSVDDSQKIQSQQQALEEEPVAESFDSITPIELEFDELMKMSIPALVALMLNRDLPEGGRETIQAVISVRQHLEQRRQFQITVVMSAIIIAISLIPYSCQRFTEPIAMPEKNPAPEEKIEPEKPVLLQCISKS